MDQDDRAPSGKIPTLEALEERERRDRMETEELLSGFDRPARARRRRSEARDFVDYYGGPRTSKPAEPPRSRPAAPERAKATLIVPKRRRPWTILPWIAVASGMIGLGVLIAVLATPPEAAPTRSPARPPLPRATTTSTAPAPPARNDLTRDL